MGFGKPKQGDMVTYHDINKQGHAAIVNTVVKPDERIVNLTVFFPTGSVGVMNISDKTDSPNGYWKHR